MVDSSIYLRLLKPPRESFFLVGVRGVGKSTWAGTRFGEARRVNLLDEGVHHSHLADPSLFAAELTDLRRGQCVVVDEVQRIPSLLNDVHRLIEARGLRFALLGSSARKLKTAGTNLLAGRARWKTMFPLVPEELGDDFSLDEVLSSGSIPLVWNSTDKRKTLEAYVQLYLREEIRGEALVRNLPGFVRFLPIAALFHGQVINVAGIARDAGTARTTVAGYLDILEDTLLATRLPAYEARLRVRERKHPKLYWVDPGLVRAVKRQLGPLAGEERGALFEGWVFALLRTYAEERAIYDEIFYWSPPAGSATEVDFLLRRGREFLAVEVKSSARPGVRGSLRGAGRVLAQGLCADPLPGLPGRARACLPLPGTQLLSELPGQGLRTAATKYELADLSHSEFHARMEQFIAKHADKIRGPLSCFERIHFRGYLPFFSGPAMAAFLDRRGIGRCKLKKFLLLQG